jgi:hypothetical protein
MAGTPAPHRYDFHTRILAPGTLETTVKFLMLFLAWCLLFAVSWPIALLGLAMAPLVWLALLPFRLIALVVHAVFAFVGALLFLPARLLGYRPSH